MDGDRSMANRRDLLESELQKLVRKVWNEACKYGDVLYYARVDKEVFLCGYDFDIHELLISYLDGPSGDVGPQDENSEEGEMGDGGRQQPDLTLEPLVEQMLKNRHRAEKEAFLQGFEEGWADGCKIFERYLSQNGIELPSAKPQVSETL